MSKSVWSILGIGAAGLILLSLMMQHLAESVVERARSPYAAAVETRLGSKRVGRVRIDKVQDGGRAQFTLRATVLPGFAVQKVAEAAGCELWLGAMRAGDRVDEVLVTLREEGQDGAGAAFVVPRPQGGR